MFDVSSAAWHHGSPLRLTLLREGSTITPLRDLARIFSHKPSVVSIGDDGAIRHNGTLPGFLYAIDEPVSEADAIPHPETSMEPGMEWLTRRPLRLRLLEPTEPRASEFLSEEDIARLRGIDSEPRKS